MDEPTQERGTEGYRIELVPTEAVGQEVEGFAHDPSAAQPVEINAARVEITPVGGGERIVLEVVGDEGALGVVSGPPEVEGYILPPHILTPMPLNSSKPHTTRPPAPKLIDSSRLSLG